MQPFMLLSLSFKQFECYRRLEESIFSFPSTLRADTLYYSQRGVNFRVHTSEEAFRIYSFICENLHRALSLMTEQDFFIFFGCDIICNQSYSLLQPHKCLRANLPYLVRNMISLRCCLDTELLHQFFPVITVLALTPKTMISVSCMSGN